MCCSIGSNTTGWGMWRWSLGRVLLSGTTHLQAEWRSDLLSMQVSFPWSAISRVMGNKACRLGYGSNCITQADGCLRWHHRYSTECQVMSDKRCYCQTAYTTRLSHVTQHNTTEAAVERKFVWLPAQQCQHASGVPSCQPAATESEIIRQPLRLYPGAAVSAQHTKSLHIRSVPT